MKSNKDIIKPTVMADLVKYQEGSVVSREIINKPTDGSDTDKVVK